MPWARGLKQQEVFSHGSRDWSPRPRCWAGWWWVSGESSVLGWGWLPSHCKLSGREREREESGLFLFFKGTNPIIRASASWPHVNFILSQRPHLQMPSHWDWGFHMGTWRSHGHSAHHRWLRCLSTVSSSSPLPSLPAFPSWLLSVHHGQAGRQALGGCSNGRLCLLLLQELPWWVQHGQRREDGGQPGHRRDELQQLHGGEAHATPKHDHQRAPRHRPRRSEARPAARAFLGLRSALSSCPWRWALWAARTYGCGWASRYCSPVVKCSLPCACTCVCVCVRENRRRVTFPRRTCLFSELIWC